MHRRLIIYTGVLIFLLSAIFMGAAMLFGRFSYVEQRTADTLALQLSVFERDMTNHFDYVAACGIKYSEDLAACLEAELLTLGISFDALNDDPDAIEGMQAALYGSVYRAFELSDCSGVYYLLNATANTLLPGADRSKCGMYIKIANVNVKQPVNPKLVLFRGYSSILEGRRMEYHNMWALEFDSGIFPDYDLLMEKANKDLNSCFLFTDLIRLPGTWENVILFCVPIVGQDGTIYGICGFEISQLYFKLRHAQSGAVPHMTGLLARRTGAGLDADVGFECGDMTGYFTELTGTFKSVPRSGFLVYTSSDGEFVGMEMPVRLSPLEQARIVAVMMPKDDFDALRAANMRENIIIVALLAMTAIFGSVYMSRMYIKPILQGLKQAANGNVPEGNVHIQEIEELMQNLKELHSNDKSIPEDLFKSFIAGVKTLTPAEDEVFRQYVAGKSLVEITENIHISMSTLKKHNSRIYQKLGISSNDELTLYVDLIKKCGLEEKIF